MKRNSMLAMMAGLAIASTANVKVEEPNTVNKPNPAQPPAPYSKPYKRANWNKKNHSESLQRMLRKAKK